MRKFLFLLVASLLVVPAFLSAQQIDVGVGITPMSLVKSADATAMEQIYGTNSGGNFFQDNAVGLHAGVSIGGFLYASGDANIMPPWWIKSATEYVDSTGALLTGVYAPGFLSMVDVGIRPELGSIILLAEAGINFLYVQSDYATQLTEQQKQAGVNLRVGAGVKFSGFGLLVTGTSIFTSFDAMVSSLKGAATGDKMAIDSLISSLIPSLSLSLQF